MHHQYTQSTSLKSRRSAQCRQAFKRALIRVGTEVIIGNVCMSDEIANDWVGLCILRQGDHSTACTTQTGMSKKRRRRKKVWISKKQQKANHLGKIVKQKCVHDYVKMQARPHVQSPFSETIGLKRSVSRDGRVGAVTNQSTLHWRWLRMSNSIPSK